MWKQWIVILCSEDWYTLYEGYTIVKARTQAEAAKKGLKGRSSHIFVQDVIGPLPVGAL
jgi:hypothetical protein